MTRSDLLETIQPYFKRGCQNDCWPWIAHVAPTGYAGFWLGRKFKPHKVSAHRLMFSLQYGPIPDGLQACHKCDNRRCVNPGHIFLGTHKDNADDRERKGRGNHKGNSNFRNRGPRNGNSRITIEQLREIRSMLKRGVYQKEIALQFPISQTQVSAIKLGKSYVGIE